MDGEADQKDERVDGKFDCVMSGDLIVIVTYLASFPS